METNFISVMAITVICYLAAQGIKATKLNSKWLPVICGSLGAVLGYLGMIIMPEFPANDPMTALAVGIVSGLAATGSRELITQMGWNKNENHRTKL